MQRSKKIKEAISAFGILSYILYFIPDSSHIPLMIMHACMSQALDVAILDDMCARTHLNHAIAAKYRLST